MATSRNFLIRRRSVAQPLSVVLLTGHGQGRLCCIALLLPCLAGCGSELASVGGIVRLDGKPVAEAGVVFHPKDGGPVASGTTDAAGRYRLETGSRSGVPPGEYRVTVSKERISGVGTNGLVLPGGIKSEHFVPPAYSNPATSPLLVMVNHGKQNHDFELTSGPAPSVR